MIRDYKSRRDTLFFAAHHQHKRLRFVTLTLGIFCATAIYASLQLLQNNPTGESEQETATISPQFVWLALPTPDSTKTAGASSSDLNQLEVLNTKKESAAADLAAPKIYVNHFPSITQDSPQLEPIDLTTSAKPGLKVNQHWIEERVRAGDSLARIFSRLGLSANLLHRVTQSSKAAAQLARIKPGETLKVLLDEEKNLRELIHLYSPAKSLQITANNDGFTSKVIEREYEIRQTSASGTITDSLFRSGGEAGLPDAMIMDLASIFGWDIDFALEIRAGDSFSVIYEEKYLDGERQGNGAILAAEFRNRGKRFRAVRFIDDHGRSNYFSPGGKSMRKTFLRAPVDFRRISSKFTPTRWHPVLGKRRPHRGVDYAAKTGTPVKAAGDGKVIYRGRKGGYGNTLIIQHPNHYTTLYAHLSKFRGTVKKGSRVKQGDIIGYVGMTGLATGPHLHYEFRINSVHRNPLTVKLPSASPIAKKYSDRFKKRSKPLLTKLDAISNSMLAEADQTHY